jgi:hypothetical protein
VLGRGWSLFWESRLEHYQDGLVWRAPSGDYVAFPKVPRAAHLLRKRKNWLEHHQDDSWSVYDVSGERWHYAPLKDDARRCSSASLNPAATDPLRVECG